MLNPFYESMKNVIMSSAEFANSIVSDPEVLLTHCILNRLSHTIYWKSPISILGMSGYEIYIFLEKMAKLFANSGDPDQTPLNAASD